MNTPSGLGAGDQSARNNQQIRGNTSSNPGI